MKLTLIFCTILIVLFGASSLNAEIYQWVDEFGVKRYSNVPPPEGQEAKIVFEEYEYDKSADQERMQSDQEILETLVDEIEAEDRKARAEQEKKSAEEKANEPMSRDEMIAAETERLLKKIADLEAKPLEFFGSQRNKTLTIGFYKYRLEDLARDPDRYFKEPVRFEGNVKYSDYY